MKTLAIIKDIIISMLILSLNKYAPPSKTNAAELVMNTAPAYSTAFTQGNHICNTYITKSIDLV